MAQWIQGAVKHPGRLTKANKRPKVPAKKR